MRFDAYRNVYAFPARCIPFMILGRFCGVK